MIGAGSQGLPTVLIGFGRIGQGYAFDPVMARHFQYASHAQVLRDHPRFRWAAVVDPSDEAREAARSQWNVPVVAADPAALGALAESIEIAVIATGPEVRTGLLSAFPRLRGIVVEKPLGRTRAEAEAFVHACQERGITITVNLWRRADERFRELANGRLRQLIGEVQAVHCLYGNGLVNNGTHMIDFVRMLFGEVRECQLLGSKRGFEEGPITKDANPDFALELQNGAMVAFSALRFGAYRENGLVAWGTAGRLDILAEGLSIRHYPVAAHRAMQSEREVVVDEPTTLEATVGKAYYALYDNLAESLDGKATVYSPADSALETTAWVDRIREADQAKPDV